MLLNTVRQQFSNCKYKHLSYSVIHNIRAFIWRESHRIPVLVHTGNKQGVSNLCKSEIHFSSASANLDKYGVKTSLKNKRDNRKTARAEEVVESGSVSGEAWEDTFGNLTDACTRGPQHPYTQGQERTSGVTEEDR
jgi:hypothetical protein